MRSTKPVLSWFSYINQQCLQKKKKRTVFLMMIVLFISACSTHRHPTIPPIPPDPARGQDAVSLFLKDVDFKDGIPEDLSDRLSRLTLNDVVRIAIQNNPSTRSYYYQVNASEAKFQADRSILFPELNFSASGSRSQSLAPPSQLTKAITTFGLSGTLTYLLYDFGGSSGLIESSRLTWMATGWQYNSMVQDTILAVESAYFKYMAMKSLLEAEKLNVYEAQIHLEAAQQRHHVGLATVSDVLSAQTVLSRAELALLLVQGDIQTTRGALALSMGIPANTPYDIDDEPGHLPMSAVTERIEELIEKSIESRPDLIAAKARVASAQAHVQEVRAQQFPSFRITGSWGRTYFEDEDYHRDDGRSYSDTYSAGLSMQFPFFNGFKNSSKTQQARHQWESEAAQFKSLEQKIIYQVFTAFHNLKIAAQRVNASDDLLASAQQSETVALARYKEGVGSMIDLQSAQSLLADARSQNIQARWGWYQAFAQLAHDTGTLEIDGTLFSGKHTSGTGENTHESE